MLKLSRNLKKIFFICAVLLLSIFSVYVYLQFDTDTNPKSTNPSPLSEKQQVLGFGSQIKTVELQKEIVASWYVVSQPVKLILMSNLQHKQTAQTIFDNQNCKFLVSSGFYDIDDTHIGLFQFKDEQTSPLQSNELLNGFLTVNSFGTPMVADTLSDDDLYLALQSGPLIYQNGQKIKLNLSSDKHSRRIIAVVTGKNELLFIALYSNKQIFDGPYLSEVPNLLDTFVNKTGISIADAVNLDGGKASAFLSDDFSLTELSIIGGYFCYPR